MNIGTGIATALAALGDEALTDELPWDNFHTYVWGKSGAQYIYDGFANRVNVYTPDAAARVKIDNYTTPIATPDPTPPAPTPEPAPAYPTYNIAIVNRSSSPDTMFAGSALDAYQTQISRDLAPIWQVDAKLSFVGKNEPVPSGVWLLYLLDNADVQGALGYHTDDGFPQSKVFVHTTLSAGLNPHVTITHELLEMLVDPTTTLTETRGTITYAEEICDAVEDDRYGYMINGVMVTDFMLPGWFTGVGPYYDFQRHCLTAGQILINGYMLEKAGNGPWHQVFGSESKATRPGSSGRSNRRVSSQPHAFRFV